MKNKSLAVFLASLAIVVVVASLLIPQAQTVSGAPAAAVTPISVDASGAGPVVFSWTGPQATSARVFTADVVTPCIDLAGYQKLDLYYEIDHGTVMNTTTLTMKYGNSTGDLLTGLALVSASNSDTSGGNQFQRFMRYTCIDVNVANSNPITITINALAQ